MFANNLFLSVMLMTISITALTFSSISLYHFYKIDRLKTAICMGLIFICSFGISFLIFQPIHDGSTRIIKNKQFMILDDNGVCKEVIIPNKGKKFKFPCDILDN